MTDGSKEALGNALRVLWPGRAGDLEFVIQRLDKLGFVIVPKEPTQTMSVNGGLAIEDAAFGEQKLIFEAAADAYRIMVRIGSGDFEKSGEPRHGT